MLALLCISSLCLGAAWAVPAKEERRKAEKLNDDLELYNPDNYDLTLDNYGDIIDLSNYEELYDYGDFAPKVRGTQGSFSLGASQERGLTNGCRTSFLHSPTSSGGFSTAVAVFAGRGWHPGSSPQEPHGSPNPGCCGRAHEAAASEPSSIHPCTG